jgi:hypothetical protein
MALENKYNLIVNLKAKRYGGVVPNVTANDNTVFEIQVIDDTVAYPLLDTYRFTLVTYKKNKPSVIREGSLTSGGLVRFELGSSETTVSGKVEAMVQIYDEADNRISSAPLTYNVIGDPSLNGSLPADETTLVIANETLLTESIEKSEQAMARVDELITQVPQPSEVVDARGGEVTLGSRLNNLSSSLAQKATNIKTQSDLQKEIDKNASVTVNIGSEVEITTNLTIPSRIKLIFTHGGRLKVNSGITLTVNGIIEAGYYQIFELVDATSVLTSTEYKGEICVDWFGADPRVTFSYDYATTNGTPTGVDSSTAFKNCMKFAQSIRNAVVKYTPNGNYYVTGDNPCGLQNDVNLSAKVNIQGNRARIYWKPNLSTDSCFKKLGLLYYSNFENFDVITLGTSGDRKGIVFNTKLGFTNDHFFSRCKFDSIKVNAGTLMGCDKVFNFESDGTATHDDMSEFTNIEAVNYNSFANINNNEAVKNIFRNCFTIAYTNNAKTFNLVCTSFGGYLTIENHQFIVFNNDETLVYTSEQNKAYPIDMLDCRLEVRGAIPFKICDLHSMTLNINGLSTNPGGGTIVTSNNYYYIGKYASLVLENCNQFFGKGQVEKVATVTNNLTGYYLIAKRCLFALNIGGTNVQVNFPEIVYDAYTNRKAALAAGAIYKKILIEEPSTQVDGSCLPIEYAGLGSQKKFEIVLSEVLSTGKCSLSTRSYLPKDILIESMYLYVEGFTTTNINKLTVSIVEPGGANPMNISTNFTGVAVNGELVPSGKYITAPVFSLLYFYWFLNSTQVTDKTMFPEARLVIRYRSINSNRESGTSGTIEQINVI